MEPLFKTQEFRDGKRKALNERNLPGKGLCECRSHMPTKPTQSTILHGKTILYGNFLKSLVNERIVKEELWATVGVRQWLILVWCSSFSITRNTDSVSELSLELWSKPSPCWEWFQWLNWTKNDVVPYCHWDIVVNYFYIFDLAFFIWWKGVPKEIPYIWKILPMKE